jgi:hypothetical protein
VAFQLIHAVILLGLIGSPQGPPGASRVLIRGVVRDPSGAVLSGVSVYLRGTDTLAVSSDDGRFELSGTTKGDATVVAVFPGFRALERKVSLGEEPLMLSLTLELERHEERVEVVARTITADPPGPLRMLPLDVLRTAGTDADPMRALQMLPGLVKTDEGAGLFVRGGDVSETATFLDRALLFHPYRYETPNGGFFGTVDPYLISGLSLSTGAFPARYGNALSGVLELTGLDRPQRVSLSAGVGLAAVSASLALPLGDHFGARFSGNKSISRLLFAVNPGDQHFTTYPAGTDLNVSVYLDASRAGQFKVSGFTNRETVGVEVQQDAFTGELDSDDSNRLISLNWQKALGGRWMLTATASRSAYRESLRVGALDLAARDSGERLRLDASGPVDQWTVRAGLEGERQGTTFLGTISVHGGDLGGVQGVRLSSFDRIEWRAGGYTEAERRLGRATVNIGARVDRFETLGAWTGDPRVSLTYALYSNHQLRLAWGIYHQAPSPGYLDRAYGNPVLGPMCARHLVFGYQYGEQSARVYLRLEGYTKQYRRLPLEDSSLNFNDRGYGFAQGADLFLKLAPSSRWQGWASYSFVKARRLYTPLEEFRRYDTAANPFRPDFEIPHTLQLAAQGSIADSIGVGASFRVASGKPFTPIVGGRAMAGEFVPVFGPVNSERLPLYQRLDLNFSHSRSIEGKASLILYLGVTNALDHKNVFQYFYSPDYRQRVPAQGTWGRAFYVGMSVQH